MTKSTFLFLFPCVLITMIACNNSGQEQSHINSDTASKSQIVFNTSGMHYYYTEFLSKAINNCDTSWLNINLPNTFSFIDINGNVLNKEAFLMYLKDSGALIPPYRKSSLDTLISFSGFFKNNIQQLHITRKFQAKYRPGYKTPRDSVLLHFKEVFKLHNKKDYWRVDTIRIEVEESS